MRERLHLAQAWQPLTAFDVHGNPLACDALPSSLSELFQRILKLVPFFQFDCSLFLHRKPASFIKDVAMHAARVKCSLYRPPFRRIIRVSFCTGLVFRNSSFASLLTPRPPFFRRYLRLKSRYALFEEYLTVWRHLFCHGYSTDSGPRKCTYAAERTHTGASLDQCARTHIGVDETKPGVYCHVSDVSLGISLPRTRSFGINFYPLYTVTVKQSIIRSLHFIYLHF